MRRVEVVSWNLDQFATEANAPRLERILSLSWDLLMLQEVTPIMRDALRSAGPDWRSAFGVDEHEAPRDRQHGVAILARNGFELLEVVPIPGVHKPGRGLLARVRAPGGETFRTASWHAPNAVGDGRDVKMATYEAITACMNSLDGPALLAFDGNHWNLGTSLDPTPEPERDEWFAENVFYCGAPPHELRDAYLEYLRAHPHEHARALEVRPEGPLAVTYVRGSAESPQPDRFDYVFASEHFGIERVWHEYEASIEAGSDHATVHAELVLNVSD